MQNKNVTPNEPELTITDELIEELTLFIDIAEVAFDEPTEDLKALVFYARKLIAKAKGEL